MVEYSDKYSERKFSSSKPSDGKGNLHVSYYKMQKCEAFISASACLQFNVEIYLFIYIYKAYYFYVVSVDGQSGGQCLGSSFVIRHPSRLAYTVKFRLPCYFKFFSSLLKHWNGWKGLKRGWTGKLHSEKVQIPCQRDNNCYRGNRYMNQYKHYVEINKLIKRKTAIAYCLEHNAAPSQLLQNFITISNSSSRMFMYIVSFVVLHTIFTFIFVPFVLSAVESCCKMFNHLGHNTLFMIPPPPLFCSFLL